jgi:hypothetical protein
MRHNSNNPFSILEPCSHHVHSAFDTTADDQNKQIHIASVGGDELMVIEAFRINFKNLRSKITQYLTHVRMPNISQDGDLNLSIHLNAVG